MMKLAGLTIGSSTPTPVAEYEAEGEIERVYHEIRQCLRVTGVNLIFRIWAGFPKFLPVLWDELRPNVETTLFEEAARHLREQAEQAAGGFSTSEPGVPNQLGESRAWQIRAALDLYHSIDPKLLVVAAAVCQALQGVHVGSGAVSQAGKVLRGEPPKMFPMELELEQPEDRALRRLFRDIQSTLSLPSISSDYRTLALWPDYLAFAWNHLKPLCQSPEYRQACDQLRDRAREVARTLPYPISVTLGRLKELGEDPERVQETAHEFERLLPALILNNAVLVREWRRTEESMAEPEPRQPVGAAAVELKTGERRAHRSIAMTREEAGPDWRAYQKRQRLMELGNRYVSYVDEGNGEPVVLLHGIPTWGYLWQSIIESLRPRYRVLVPDLLGFGYSEKRDCFDRSLAAQTAMIDQWLENLGVSAAHLVGHDIGGGIALRMATLLPKRVHSLCVMNSVCYDSWPVEVMLQLGHPSERRRLSAPKTIRALRQGLAMGFHKAPEAAWLDGLLSPWRTEVGKLSLIRNAVALDTNHTTELTALLPHINVPTMIVWGEEDPFLPVKYGQWLAKDIPGANLLRIADARHFVMIDQPARVTGALLEFLGRHLQEQRAAA